MDEEELLETEEAWGPPDDEDLREYEPMWTTERDEYLLVQLSREDGGPDNVYGIIGRHRGGIGAAFSILMMDDTELHHLIAQNMLQAGVRTMEEEKFLSYLSQNQWPE